nr:MAG TPA: hypothetical protein [Caudoviricetes sp.]
MGCQNSHEQSEGALSAPVMRRGGHKPVSQI